MADAVVMGAVRSRARFEGLDLARFLAFVGMVIVNFTIVMGAETGAETGAGVGAGVEGGGGLLAGMTLLLEGRAAATFVVLAGLGLGLAASRGMERTVSDTIRRALFLLVVGLLNSLIFDADILHYYAFYFLFGVFLLPLRTWTLVWVIVALNIAFVGMNFVLDYDTGRDWVDYSYADFWTPAGFVRNLFFNGWHPVIPWLGFLLFGVILSRLDLGERRVRNALALGGLAAFLLAEVLAARLQPLLGAIDPELAYLVATGPVPPMPLYTLAGMGVASLVIGLCLSLAERPAMAPVMRAVVPAGRQTLTLYIAHIVVGMGALEALGMLGGQTPGAAVLAALIFCAASAVFAFVWSHAFKRGPVETLMRWVAG
ncbi:DUF418 domain-containing protein [Nitratireductor aquimarinus]|uniref:DUF418 domain-containing protein n=1 Tax=Nitratireductor TaxID=245876 RepID=UPI0019D33AEB|nr:MULTISPECIES: DUF418 domain-containing protein [Nitratireductor]MBN7777407.1 DUF418 domain-containing protein [Nitratireductor pacificus]MBN7781078.1 DUF418 domain-containing protein [Nitratireductor pacificus]MBN7789884.1 DUF418 domain-containing protein [Nitratireductor aquimarinus]